MQILHPLHLHLQGVWETMQCSEDDKECIGAFCTFYAGERPGVIDTYCQ